MPTTKSPAPNISQVGGSGRAKSETFADKSLTPGGYSPESPNSAAASFVDPTAKAPTFPIARLKIIGVVKQAAGIESTVGLQNSNEEGVDLRIQFRDAENGLPNIVGGIRPDHTRIAEHNLAVQRDLVELVPKLGFIERRQIVDDRVVSRQRCLQVFAVVSERELPAGRRTPARTPKGHA